MLQQQQQCSMDNDRIFIKILIEVINRTLQFNIFLHLYSSSSNILVEAVDIVIDEDINRVID